MFEGASGVEPWQRVMEEDTERMIMSPLGEDVAGTIPLPGSQFDDNFYMTSTQLVANQNNYGVLSGWNVATSNLETV